jgi:hypothetical protein
MSLAPVQPPWKVCHTGEGKCQLATKGLDVKNTYDQASDQFRGRVSFPNSVDRERNRVLQGP